MHSNSLHRLTLGVPASAALILALALAPATARAGARGASSLLSDTSPWAACERAAIATEATRKLPRALLVSVSMVESGRFNPDKGATRAWPWTINAEGQSFYFDTKKKAVAATRRLLNAGVRSIDVGCMQVNLHYHPQAFATLEDAFEPLTNVAYGATFLKQLHAKTKSWPKAIAQYHSESTELNQPYFARVIGVWTGQRERVAALTRELEKEAVAHIDAPIRTEGADAAAKTEAVVVADAQAATPASRPAPMVLDSNAGEDVHEGAIATVGLRLSISDDPQAKLTQTGHLPPPRVLEPASPAQTILADATPGA